MHPCELFDLCTRHSLTFFTGVPDSLLKDFCAYITDNTSADQHIIAANEGNAIALAAGYHLATGNIGVVYMQNSGLGNCINPLTSLTDPDVYSIPLLMIIGWRAEPGVKDEPQHQKMGKVMQDVLHSIAIPYSILPSSIIEAEKCLKEAVAYMKKNKAPYAIIVKANTFESYKLQKKKQTSFPLNRELALRSIIPLLDEKDIVVSTTGKTSRELFELREELCQGHEKDFLTVGCMGHASSIALGISLQKPERSIYCIDGDGAAIMHMGALATIGKLQPANFKHIIINNFAHDSVGGQPTAADILDIPALARASGYKAAFSAETEEEVTSGFKKIKERSGPALLEIKCNKGVRENLGRPTRTPLENKWDFMAFVSENSLEDKNNQKDKNDLPEKKENSGENSTESLEENLKENLQKGGKEKP